MDSINILKEKEYKVKPFKKVILGDPMYLDAINDGTDTGIMKKLSLIMKTPISNRETRVKLIEKEINYKIMDEIDSFINYSLVIFQCKKDFKLKDKVFDAFEKGAFYENIVKNHHILGCDTAEFMIQINDKCLNISTLADGDYGWYCHYKNNDALCIQLDLDEDATTWKEMETNIKYLFDII